MTEIRRNEPAKEKQIEKLRFFGCTWDDGITAGQASDALEECAKLFPDREAAWQLQKADLLKAAEKLPQTPQQYLERTGRASDPAWQRWAKAKQVSPPEVKIQKTEIVKSPTTFAAAPASIPPSPEQLNEIRSFGKEPPDGLTFAEAEIWIEQCKILCPAKSKNESPQEVTIQEAEIVKSPTTPAAAPAFIPPKPEQPNELKFAEEDKLIGRRKILHLVKLRADHLQIATARIAEPTASPTSVRREGFFCGATESIKQPSESLPEVPIQKAEPDVNRERKLTFDEAKQMGQKEWNEWLAIHQGFPVHQQSIKTHGESSPEVKIQKVETVAIPTVVSRKDSNSATGKEYTIPVREALDSTPRSPAVTAHQQKPVDSKSYMSRVTLEQLDEIRSYGEKPTSELIYYGAAQIWIENCKARKNLVKPQSLNDLLKDCPSSDGCYWLPVIVAAKLANIFSETKLTNSESRQIANKIEWFGYCFEPDSRYGNGTYDIDQTLAVFKPFEGDQINPSTAYLGAGNLLRLCVLIAVADGQIDEVELEVFRQVIENQIDLTPTDHRRLQILEKLLVQDPSSAKKTLATVIKSVPAHKRLLIGKVLVRVAAADTVITKDERRALERIFKAFEISQDTLENLMFQACPPSPGVTGQKSSAVSISAKPVAPKESETELSQKDWDEWLALHERLSARQKLPSPEVSTDEHIFIPREARGRMISTFQVSTRLRNIFEQKQFRILGDIHDISYAEFRKFPNCGSRTVEELRELVQKIRCEPMSGQAATPAPRDFALDMAKVYSITNETQEVVGILSVLMADEPEKTIAPSATITLPAPEIPKVSGDGNAAPQPTRFNGLDAAFCPILERLLTRDSWPVADFNALAHEVQFMPLNIRDTLNVWSDEALGDFILDGEDPVIIRRNLITK